CGVVWIDGQTAAVPTRVESPIRAAVARLVLFDAGVLGSSVGVGAIGAAASADIDDAEQRGGDVVVEAEPGAIVATGAGPDAPIGSHINTRRRGTAPVGFGTEDNGVVIVMEFLIANLGEPRAAIR